MVVVGGGGGAVHVWRYFMMPILIDQLVIQTCEEKTQAPSLIERLSLVHAGRLWPIMLMLVVLPIIPACLPITLPCFPIMLVKNECSGIALIHVCIYVASLSKTVLSYWKKNYHFACIDPLLLAQLSNRDNYMAVSYKLYLFGPTGDAFAAYTTINFYNLL